MLAFESARQLMVEGEEIGALFLLDFEDLPSSSAEAANLPGQSVPNRRSMEPGQIEHMKNTAHVLQSYRPAVLPSDIKTCLYVHSQRTVNGEGSAVEWSDLNPGLSKKTDSEVLQGSFLTTTNVSCSSLGVRFLSYRANSINRSVSWALLLRSHSQVSICRHGRYLGSFQKKGLFQDYQR